MPVQIQNWTQGLGGHSKARKGVSKEEKCTQKQESAKGRKAFLKVTITEKVCRCLTRSYILQAKPRLLKHVYSFLPRNDETESNSGKGSKCAKQQHGLIL